MAKNTGLKTEYYLRRLDALGSGFPPIAKYSTLLAVQLGPYSSSNVTATPLRTVKDLQFGQHHPPNNLIFNQRSQKQIYLSLSSIRVFCGFLGNLLIYCSPGRHLPLCSRQINLYV